MMRYIYGFLTVCTILAISISFSPTNVFAQSTGTPGGNVAPPAPAAPGGAPPPNFPEYMVTPRDNLNPYGLSTMDSTTESGNRDGAGTLGTTTKRRTNTEINESLAAKEAEEKAKAEEAAKKAEQEANARGEAPEGPAPNQDFSSTEDGDFTTPGVKGGLFTWTDDDGTVNATNDLGNVPVQYQMEALRNQEALKKKQQEK